MTLIMTAVLPPLSHFNHHFQWDSVPVALAFSIVLLAVAKYNHDRGMRLVVIMSISFHLTFRLFLMFSDTREVLQDDLVKSLRIGVSIAFMGLIITILIRHLWTSRISGGDSLWVASALYLMMAILFAQVYTLAYMLDPNSFRIDGDLDRIGEGHPAHHRFPIFLYYSTVVITTVGFGDITPVTRFARSFTWFEALAGQLYLVILMGRIVSMQLTASTTPEKKRKKRRKSRLKAVYGLENRPAVERDDPSALILARMEPPARMEPSVQREVQAWRETGQNEWLEPQAKSA